MKKILIVATLDSHIKAFHQPIIADLIENNWVVDVASNGNDKFEGVRNKYNISIYRSPFNLKKLKRFNSIKKRLSRKINMI